jgi:muramoyltetrapeptide carboxypeptidase
MAIIPRYLTPGDTIGLVCPAGHMPLTRMRTCIRILEEEWGFRVRRGRTLGTGSGYFSGTDSERLADLQEMLDDDSVHAVLCARGGYGVGRIVDAIDFSRFLQRPKWIVGFSDITVLHLHIQARHGVATLHAPMAGAFNAGGWRGPYVESLHRALRGERLGYASPHHPFNREGKAEGILLGGNLALMAHLVGTPSFPDTHGCILFLEDVGEQLYNIDRMMRQLLRSGKLDRLAGLIVGGFTDCRDTERPFGQTAYDIIRDVVAPFSYPVCFGFPVSHGRENVALKSGCRHRLTVDGDAKLDEVSRRRA